MGSLKASIIEKRDHILDDTNEEVTEHFAIKRKNVNRALVFDASVLFLCKQGKSL